MPREGFVAYHEWTESLRPYGDAECGRLFRAMLKYSETGEEEEFSGNEKYIWPTFRMKIDKDKAAYDAKCQQMAANASKSKQTDAEATKSKQTDAEATKSPPTKTKTKTETKQKPKTQDKGSSAHARGQFGWVKLTDAQYEQLQADLGQEELDRCIRYVDESAQSTGNRNGWKDWNLTIRKCSRDGWGKQAPQSPKPKQYTTQENYTAPAKKLTVDELYGLVDKI